MTADLQTEGGINNFFDAKEALQYAFDVNAPCINKEISNKDEYKMVDYLVERFDPEYCGSNISVQDIKTERDRLLENWLGFRNKGKFEKKLNDTLKITGKGEFNQEDYNRAFTIIHLQK